MASFAMKDWLRFARAIPERWLFRPSKLLQQCFQPTTTQTLRGPCLAYFPVNSNQIPEVLLDLSISNYLRSIMLILYRYLHSQIVSEVHPYPRCLQCATQHHRLASLSLFVDCDQKSKYHNILHAKFHLHQYRAGMGDVDRGEGKGKEKRGNKRTGKKGVASAPRKNCCVHSCFNLLGY